MYRLLSARNVYQNGFHNIAIPTNKSIQESVVPEIKCSFCRKILLGRHNIENIFLVRHQSTRTANAVLKSSKKKVKYKYRQQYGELLEVGDKSMTEMKVSINKLRADHLSKLASSSVSLGQLHQLTKKPQQPKRVPEIDPELLQTVKNKILKSSTSPTITSSSSVREINLEDDKCALIFTSNAVPNIEDKFKTKKYIDMVKQSYYHFRKATLYDQKLRDLRFAINEGLNQEFDLSPFSNTETSDNTFKKPHTKGPHAVFKELFFEPQLDHYDHELMSQISSLHTKGILNGAFEDIEEELGSDVVEREDVFSDIIEPAIDVNSVNVKKMNDKIKAKKKAKREKKRARQEVDMKQEMKEIEAKGKQDALHKMLIAHLNLLCSMNMLDESRKVLQYYRSKGKKVPENPKIRDIRVYNTLLHGYAASGQYENVKDILRYLYEDSIEPDAQTFAAVFESIERSNIVDKVDKLKAYTTMMSEKGITLNDLLNKSKFLRDQRETVLAAVRRLQPNFSPVYTPPPLDYTCPLLDHLMLDKEENRMGLLRSPAEGLISVEDLKQRAKKQLEVELKGEIEVENIYNCKDDATQTDLANRKKVKEMEDEWRIVIREAFIRNLSTLKSQSNASNTAISLYPYLKVLEVDQIVELVIGQIMKLVDGSEAYSPTLKMLQRDLGSLVYQKYKVDQYRHNGVMSKLERVYGEYVSWYIRRDGPQPLNGRQAWNLLEAKLNEGASLDIQETPWPVEIRHNVGKFLYNIIINDIKINVNMFKNTNKVKRLPAVYKVHRPWGRLVRLELKPHPALVRCAGGRASLRLRAALLPLAAPARPWLRPAHGGYLLTDTPLIRLPVNVVNQEQRLEQTPLQQLYPVLDSLNQLGEVPWVINKPILDLQLQIFRSGGDKKLEIAPPPSALDVSTFGGGGGGGGGSGAAAFRRRLAINRARAEMYSLWCDALYKLALANHYRDEIFWLPHNVDFRGRVYACPPHVSQLGADTARALLLFAGKRPLGPHGLRWLKLHAVNLTGTMKKMTIDERVQYAESVTHLMLDSADRPLEGARWWAESEEPWQTLACCMEVANAIRSGNPETYQSGFPVHQDGSCNGLQHYAALGGDGPGAAAVNLSPLPTPQDVYTATANRVEEMRARDALAGVESARTLAGFVRRKVIKQTVMTTVYGVTRFGARLQIAKQLKDIDEFPKEQVWSCSQYLTARTFDSLREMFTSTKLIQDWFTDCAKAISGVCGESVEWVTPLGLPVVQPYYRRAPPTNYKHTARAPLDHHQRPCTMKQRNAFPPNFIHSLDSSHMMLTALGCQAAGLVFVSVHDCFWTHAADVDRMNEICREQFVALHSQPILEDLSKYLVQRYSYPDSEIEEDILSSVNKRRVNTLLRKVPEKGDFDINSVLDSVYFFS